MQKHKKYLVVTIWISVIAFVGAGFVGWGSYKFGRAADAVALVGETPVTYKELRREMENLRRLLPQAEPAELEKLALSRLIDEALLLQYAKDHDLMVTDAEVAAAIAAEPSFQKDGRFDRARYKELLRAAGLTEKDFEERVRKDLMLQKLLGALAAPLYDLEFDTAAGAFYVADRIEYLPLSADQVEVNATDEQVRDYYKTRLQSFMAPAKAKVGIIRVDFDSIGGIGEEQLRSHYESHRTRYRDSEGKILPFEAAKEQVAGDLAKKLAKKEALRRYLALKKGKTAPEANLTVSLEGDDALPAPLLEQLRQAKAGATLKPKADERGYVVAKLYERIPPAPRPFEEVAAEAKAALLKELRSKALEARAKELLENFSGETTDYICRDDIGAIKGLDEAEATLFLKKLFVSTESKGIIKLSDVKIVLFKILDQKLGLKSKIDANKELIKAGATDLKTRLQYRGLIEKLKKIYPIEVSGKGS